MVDVYGIALATSQCDDTIIVAIVLALLKSQKEFILINKPKPCAGDVFVKDSQ